MRQRAEDTPLAKRPEESPAPPRGSAANWHPLVQEAVGIVHGALYLACTIAGVPSEIREEVDLLLDIRITLGEKDLG